MDAKSRGLPRSHPHSQRPGWDQGRYGTVVEEHAQPCKVVAVPAHHGILNAIPGDGSFAAIKGQLMSIEKDTNP